MERRTNARSDQWTDEDIFYARRKASFRTMILAITAGISLVVFKLSAYYQSQAGPSPSPQVMTKVSTLETLGICVLLMALVLGVWTLGGWLDYIQRRGSRELEANDPI